MSPATFCLYSDCRRFFLLQIRSPCTGTQQTTKRQSRSSTREFPWAWHRVACFLMHLSQWRLTQSDSGQLTPRRPRILFLKLSLSNLEVPWLILRVASSLDLTYDLGDSLRGVGHVSDNLKSATSEIKPNKYDSSSRNLVFFVLQKYMTKIMA